MRTINEAAEIFINLIVLKDFEDMREAIAPENKSEIERLMKDVALETGLPKEEIVEAYMRAVETLQMRRLLNQAKRRRKLSKL